MPDTPVVNAVPPWVQRVTVAAVAVVAAVAAVVSYVHMWELGTRSGEQWRAWLLPLSVDGLLVAASMVMFVRRRAGQRAGVLPWTGVLLGLGASLAANVAVADPTWLSRVVTGWPPVALAVAFELLILVSREQPPAVARDREDAGGERETGVVSCDDIPHGVGRRRLARELGIPEHEARKLLAGRRNGRAGDPG